MLPVDKPTHFTTFLVFNGSFFPKGWAFGKLYSPDNRWANNRWAKNRSLVELKPVIHWVVDEKIQEKDKRQKKKGKEGRKKKRKKKDKEKNRKQTGDEGGFLLHLPSSSYRLFRPDSR